MNELPEGYTPLKSIWRQKEQRYMLTGYADIDSATARSKEISEHQSELFEYPVSVEMQFGFSFPESALNKLTTLERERAQIVESPVSIQPYFPTVYRFMGNAKYIDDFFNTGAIRLSTFKRCATLENKNRQDCTEGHNTVIGFKNEHTIKISTGVENAIILCTSLTAYYENDKGINENECIEIFDIQSFTRAIALKLVENGIKLQGALYGPCVYSNRDVYGNLNQKKYTEMMNQINSGSGSFDFNLMFDIAEELGGTHVYFSKPLDKSKETEFRFVWMTCENPSQEYYDIIVPEAIHYCRRRKC